MTVRRADDVAYTLLSNGAATGGSVAIKGGEYMIQVEGTAGGATFALQMQSPNGTWTPVLIFAGSAVSTTTLPYGQTAIDLPAGNVRLAVTGGTPSAIFGYLIGLG